MKVVNVCRIAKIVAFLILLIAFILPLSRCSAESSDDSSREREYDYYYAWSDFDAKSVYSWLLLLAFFWPIPFIYYSNIPKVREPLIWMSIIEILLSGISMYVIYLHTFLNELWYGGYLSYAALGLYFILSVVETIALVQGLIKKKRSEALR